jgi:hypothetical protein
MKRITLTFENNTSITVNVSNDFTSELISDCFLNKDYKGFGIVKRWFNEK